MATTSTTFNANDYMSKPLTSAATVQGQLKTITSQSSPLMEQAKAEGLKTANRRGLLNSSLAAGTSQAEVLKAATPIAQQDAQTEATRQMTDNTFRQSAGLNTQQAQINSDLSAQNAAQASALSAQESTQTRALNKDVYGYNSNLSAQNAAQTAAQSAQEAKQAQTLQSQKSTQDLALQQAQNASAEKIASWNVSQNDKQAAITATQQIDATYANTVASITGNTSLPAATRDAYLKNAATVRDSAYKMIEQIYSVDLTWATL